MVGVLEGVELTVAVMICDDRMSRQIAAIERGVAAEWVGESTGKQIPGRCCVC